MSKNQPKAGFFYSAIPLRRAKCRINLSSTKPWPYDSKIPVHNASNNPHSTNRYKSTPRGYSCTFRRKYAHKYTIMAKFQPILSPSKPASTQKTASTWLILPECATNANLQVAAKMRWQTPEARPLPCSLACPFVASQSAHHNA